MLLFNYLIIFHESNIIVAKLNVHINKEILAEMEQTQSLY